MAEKKDYFPMLPKLRENSSVTPDKAGVWENATEPSDFLRQLVKSLAVGTMAGMESIDSIPDMWARPLLFQMALYDEQKEATQEFIRGMHTMAEGEWRSLLAMIALKDVRHLSLRTFEVDLDKENASGNSLAGVLEMLPPTETISENTSWAHLYIITYQENILAMTSPATLLAPAADYRTVFGGNISQPWSADGWTLTDPIPYLTEDELSKLHGWLAKVHDEIQSTVPRAEQENRQPCKDVLRLLGEYMQAVEAKLPNVASGEKYKKAELNLNKGIFRVLDWTAEARQAKAEDSAVKLIPSVERHPSKKIILVSPDMARDFADQQGISPSHLVVWPGLSANDITEDDLDGDSNMLGSTSLGDTEFRRPEEFFTDKMAVLEPGNAFVGMRRIAGTDILAADDLSVILPLKDEILEYFTPQDIARHLSIESDNESINVVFRFPLSGVDNQSEYKFVKSYPKQELIYLQTNVPIIEIWPNIKREGWDKYYLYYENTEAQNGRMEEAGTGFFYVYPWIEKNRDINIPEHGLLNRYTARLKGFPEALICTVNMATDGSAYPQPVDVGMLVLKEPQPAKQEANLSWNIGIDFGTSSTMLYCREGRKEPKPLAFSSNLFQVTDSGATRTGTFENFIPSDTSDQQDGAFLSIFHLLNSKTMDIQKEIRPLQEGHVFWLLSNSESVDKYKKNQNSIDANLKWKEDDIGRRKVAAYIKQVCMQSLAEAALVGAKHVTWNFSYPTAFSEEQQFAFRGTCEEAVTEAYEDTGFDINADEAVEPWSESKASAYYFNHYHGSDTNFSEGAVCLDIGAGTTDVSVISGQPGRIVYHTSVQFAGRYLFAPIYKNYSLFAGDTIDDADVDREHRNALYDADMRANSEEYLKKLKTMTGREEIKEVLQMSQMAMAGVFYYVGSMLRTLHDKGVYAENRLPDIFIGGNGSRILYWLTGSTSFNKANPYLAVLKDMLACASGIEDDSKFDIFLSDRPKVEVASGMIEDRPNNDSEFYDAYAQKKALFGNTKDKFIASAMIAGDKYTVNNEEHDKEEFITARDISDGINVDSVDEIRAFVDAFNDNPHIWYDGVEISDDEYADVRKRVNGYYVSEKGKDAKRIFVEPIFIVELKKFMEMLLNDER